MSNSRPGVCDSSVTSRRSPSASCRELALRRQEHPLADDAVFGVEQRVHRLEARGSTSRRSRYSGTPAPRAAGRRGACARSRPPWPGGRGRVRAATARCFCAVGREDCDMERRDAEPELERSLSENCGSDADAPAFRGSTQCTTGTPPAPRSAGLSLSPQKRRHVERRAGLEHVFTCRQLPARLCRRPESESSTTGRRLTPTVGGAARLTSRRRRLGHGCRARGLAPPAAATAARSRPAGSSGPCRRSGPPASGAAAAAWRAAPLRSKPVAITVIFTFPVERRIDHRTEDDVRVLVRRLLDDARRLVHLHQRQIRARR